MNMILSVGTWFSQNWMILVLIVLAIAFLVPTYLRQKKEAKSRTELTNSIKKGTRIVTTAGVYGVVESVENTTDGKVVTIVTGNSKNASTMTIHINAIMGIDNKSTVVEETDIVMPTKEEVNAEEKTEKVEENKKALEKTDSVDSLEEQIQPKKKSTSKKKN
ncbi:MAG: preprotein translocase subunit YajC [Christensenellales bacterium]